MENEGQRIQVDPRNIHYIEEKRSPPVRLNIVQLPQEEDVKYLGTPWQETHLAQTHFRKTERTRNHPHQNVLATQTKVKTLYKQQTSHI
jgi:hypothetical protein